MLRLGIIVLLLSGLLTGFAQQSSKYSDDGLRYERATELFEKQKYSAAQEEYRIFMLENGDINNPLFVKARYYHALCALYLFNNGAEKLLLSFLAEYPESIHHEKIYLELGRHYYRQKDYPQTIEWLAKIDRYGMADDLREEYYFKLGYSYFREVRFKEARNSFFEILNIVGQYQGPSIYYYSHINYQEKNYETALDGFRRLIYHPSFRKAVPYYITQIYYLQGNYEKLIEYAPANIDSVEVKDEIEMSHLIGDAYYRIGKFDEAVPFLEEYNRRSSTTRDDDYQLGFAYFKSGSYSSAVQMFDKVAQKPDAMGQISLYHIGECYLKLDDFLAARNAFEGASVLSFDADIEEDALYNFAILSYKLDYNPYDEALDALTLYLKRYPNSKRNKDIYQYLINVFTTMRNYKSALKSLDEIADKDFALKNAYQLMAYNYGVELFENNQLLESMELFRTVKKFPIDPELNALSIYWIAEANTRMQDYPKALGAYREFLNEPGSYGLPQHNDAYYNMGYCYFSMQDYQNSSQNFRTFTQDVREDDEAKLTDAYLRIGDCYFATADDRNAISFYEKAIAMGGGQQDYASYQIGMSYGFAKEYDKKAVQMLDVVNNHSKSTFAVPALYEVAEAYRLMDPPNLEKSMRYYNQLVLDYPNHAKVVDAIFSIGMLQLKQKQYELAENQFLRVLNEFDNPVKDAEALEILREVYNALNQPEKYVVLLETQTGGIVDVYYKDTLLFDAAYRQYQDSMFAKAIASFEKYLATFVAPVNETEALYYLGVCNERFGNRDAQISAYERVLQKPTNVFTERCALLSARYRYERKEYDLALDHYHRLESVSSYPENSLAAWVGLMRCHAFKKEYGPGKGYANKVLINPLSEANVLIEAHFVIAKSEFEAGNYDLALFEFSEVAQKSSGAIGAESYFHVALIHHLKEEYKKSEEEIRKMMKEKAGYDYWIAKALILQAKNSIGILDYVQAEYTLNSVLKGYKIPDDGIIDEVNEVMMILKNLKEQPKVVQPEGDNTIEIGNGDSN